MAAEEAAARGAALFARLQAASPFFVIAGLNVIESEAHTLRMAHSIKAVTDSLGLLLVFKASFDKANRTSAGAYRGPGLAEGLRVLAALRAALPGVPLLTDIHEPWQAARAAAVVDVLQIPAFLCRQTDLLAAAGATRAVVHLKKGQWCAPSVAVAAAAKLREAGASGVVLCDRGTQFGLHDLVFDARAMEEMRAAPGALVSCDATHALQRPAAGADAMGRLASGGARRLVPAVARAAAAAGADAIFLEVHDRPADAPVDGGVQWPLRALRPLLRELRAIAAASSARRRGGREPTLEPPGADWAPSDEDEDAVW